MTRVLAVLLLVLLGGCSAPTGGGDGPPAEPRVTFDAALADELVQMAEQDQGRPSTATTTSDTDRVARLQEILDEHGWPTTALVGEEGEDAAWLIAQHADLDPAFQQRALELLRAAVAEGQASPGNLAYLEDRVRAAAGRPQLYGTQTGCTRRGRPAVPEVEDPAGLDERREEAGLPPYDRYLRQMTRVCARP